MKDYTSFIMLAYRKKVKETPLAEALKREAQALELLKRCQAAIITYEVIMDVIDSGDMISNIIRCQILYKKQLEKEEEARTGDAVKETRKIEKQMKAEEEEKAAKQDLVNEKLTSWVEDKYGDLRALLYSLEAILWQEILLKGFKMDISSPAVECKK